MHKYFIGLGIFALTIVGGFVIYTSTNKTPTPQTTQKTQSELSKMQEEQLSTPKKSAHYESNTPSHGDVLAGVPINVVINFNFDLDSTSSISITKDGVEYSYDELIIDPNKLSMRIKMDPNAPDGLYTVKYNSCWPDKSCHDGSFQFKIDRSQTNNYENMTGKKEVSISLKDIAINPKNVKISKGTKITWVNNDTAEHYVNTDSHPAHTYILDMNSKILGQGESYSYTFTEAGIYPYHCSAHADSMIGSILVE